VQQAAGGALIADIQLAGCSQNYGQAEIDNTHPNPTNKLLN
jgi:hypothetical protein